MKMLTVRVAKKAKKGHNEVLINLEQVAAVDVANSRVYLSSGTTFVLDDKQCAALMDQLKG